jgi:hypothetical protein
MYLHGTLKKKLKAYTLVFCQFEFKQFIMNYFCSYNVIVEIYAIEIKCLKKILKSYFLNLIRAACKSFIEMGSYLVTVITVTFRT